jgi:hypothetical protein
MNTSNNTTQKKQRAQSCPKISKRGILIEENKSAKDTGLACPLPFSKDTTPHVDMDKLAQQWVQLLMGQVQENQSKKTTRRAFDE